jgi:hypothetical protein
VPDFLLRGIEATLAERIKNLARDKNWAINDVILHLIRQGLGLVHEDVQERPLKDIATLGGTWASEETDAFREALKAFENLPEDESPFRTIGRSGKPE